MEHQFLNPSGWGKKCKYEEIMGPALRELTPPNLGNKIYRKVKEEEK